MKSVASKYLGFDNYIVVGIDPIDNQHKVIKTYENFKKALWDLDFHKLMFKDIKIYKLIYKNDEAVN